MAASQPKRHGRTSRFRWDAPHAPRPHVWAVGSWRLAEFQVVSKTVADHAGWRKLTTLAEAVDRAEAGDAPPEVILLAQSRPGCDRQELVDRLLSAAPLARLVVVAGAWCEGELRTGAPIAGVSRMYWHQFPAWWRQALADRAAGRTPAWSQPTTKWPLSPISDSALTGFAMEQRDVPPVVAIDSRDQAVFETLRTALGPYGWQSAWTSRGRGDWPAAAAGIWDGGQLDDDELGTLEAFCGRFERTPAPVVALVDFPRAEHAETIRSAGAESLLGKPYDVRALAEQLSRLVAASEPGRLTRVR